MLSACALHEDHPCSGSHLHRGASQRPCPAAPLVKITDQDPRVGLRIALVGNGRGAVRHKKGAKIDAHDLVARFNFFKTKGYELHCGSRVDIWQGRGGEDLWTHRQLGKNR